MNRLLAGMLLLLLWPGTSTVFAHEDHGSRHGGFVMMFLDLHFELVAPASGGLQIYYSDQLRMPMPAAVVSDVAVEIERAGNRIEPVAMRISDGGDFWVGDSTPVSAPDTIVRLAFLFQGEPFVLDIPASVFPEQQDLMHQFHCNQDCAG